MKKSLRLIALTGILALSVPVVLGITSNAKKVDAYTPSSLPTTIDLNDTSAANIRSYYSGLDNKSQSELTGTNLLKNLKPILKQNQKYLSYDSGNSIWDAYCIVDRDWVKSPATSLPAAAGTYNSSTNKITNYNWGNNTSTYENPYLHILYFNRDKETVARAYGDHGNGTNNPTGINREHIWPKGAGFDTNGTGGARGDIMHLWAAHGHTNNKHSNFYYGYVDTTRTYKDEVTDTVECAGNLLGYSKTFGGTTNVFEPQDCDKGDIARACFYMVARYNNLAGDDNTIDSNNPNLELVNNITSFQSSGYTSSSSSTGKLGILQDLLEWNRMDPPDEFEIHRNNLCYNNFTSNRNPFIDFPEWAEYIWGKSTNGSYSSTPTGSAAPTNDTINDFSGGGTTVSVTGVSLNKNSTSVSVGGEETLAATIAPSNATNKTVTWTSSNTNVATVTSGLITGVSEGSATITVTTLDGGFTDQCTVTVTSAPTPSPEGTISFSRTGSTNTVTSGYTLNVTNGKANADNYQDQSSLVGLDLDLIKSSGTIWTTSPDTISLTVKVGGGTTKNPLSNNVVAYFLDSNGDTISSSATVVTTKVDDTTGQEYTVTMPSTANVAGIRIHHDKESNYNVRIYSFSLSYSSSSATKTLDSISLDTSDTQTTFYVGDTFNYDDLVVTANYDDGSSDIVAPTSVSSPNMSTAGQKTVTVSYTEGDVTKTATYTITVNAVTLSSIEVSNAKTAYYVGDSFVKPTVTATFSNGSTSDVTDSATFSGYNLSNAGNQTVSVSYTSGGVTKTTYYSITVTAVSITSITISGYTTSFSVGDTFSFGGTVTAHYNNGSSSDVTTSANFTGYNMSTTGTQTVTVSYGGQTATYQITVTSSGGTTETYYQKCTSMSDIENGGRYVIIGYVSSNTTYYAMPSYSSGNNIKGVAVTLTESNTRLTEDNMSTAAVYTLTSTGTNNQYYIGDGSQYLYAAGTGTGNLLKGKAETDSTAGAFTISYSTSFSVVAASSNRNTMRFNDTNKNQTTQELEPLFSCYASNSTQTEVMFFKEVQSSPDPMTSITATVNKTFAVGETISSSDLSVKGNNGQTVYGFSFANDGYRFTYADAVSGGISTSKTFTNSVTYQTFTCSLTVNVVRTAYATPTETDFSITSSAVFGGIGGSNDDLRDGSVTYEGITYDYYQAYYYSSGSALSFGNDSSQTGYMKNQTVFEAAISDASVTSSGRSVNIRYSTDGSTWVLKANANTSTTDYKYIKVDCIGVSGSNYSNITAVNITFKAIETAKNTSNFIMFEDTSGQCTTKFNVASTYFNNMPITQRATFMTSDDYVISTARERFEAWARSLGKTISYTNGDYVIQNARSMQIIGNTTDNTALLIVIVSVIMGGIAIGGYFFIRKKKYQ